MRRFIKPTILVLCPMALVATAALVPCLMALVAAAVAEIEVNYAQVAEDIDIMAKIIDKALEERFPDEYKTSMAFLPFGGSRGCQGIYLKGYGAVFMTSINFPMAERKASQEEATPDDLWQRTKYEIRGVSSAGGSYFSYSSGGGSYDSEKVEQLKEELLRIMGTYAPNIRQLGSQENVVMAVRGTPELVRISILPSDREVGKLMEEVEKLKKEAEKLKGPEKEKLKEEAEKLKKEAEKLKGPEKEKLEEEADKAKKEAEKFKGEPKPVPQPHSGVIVGAPGAVLPTTAVVGKVDKTVGGRHKSVVVTPGHKADDYGVHELIGTVLPGDSSARSRTTLIVKVSKEIAMAYKDGGLDFDGFAKQAEIIQY